MAQGLDDRRSIGETLDRAWTVGVGPCGTRADDGEPDAARRPLPAAGPGLTMRLLRPGGGPALASRTARGRRGGPRKSWRRNVGRYAPGDRALERELEECPPRVGDRLPARPRTGGSVRPYSRGAPARAGARSRSRAGRGHGSPGGTRSASCIRTRGARSAVPTPSSSPPGAAPRSRTRPRRTACAGGRRAARRGRARPASATASELRVTTQRLRALERRGSRARARARVLQLALDENDREESARVRWVIRRRHSVPADS